MKKEIRNLREAWDFYRKCQKTPESAAFGAYDDAVEWLENAIEALLKKAES